MITDLSLTYRLASNVLNSILDLARQSDFRNYLWRIQLAHRMHQLDLYKEQIAELGVKVRLMPGDEEYIFLRIELDISEGYTNMQMVLVQESETFLVDLRNIQSVELSQATNLARSRVTVH